MLNMDDRESLQQLIARGEGKALEFKSAVPNPQHLAREIAAFANSGGGTILLGVREDGSIPGVFVSDAERSLRSATELLTPKPEALLTERPGPGGRVVGRIDVADEPAGPVAAPDGFFR
jgi:predicted HTH transcriptional regulator